MSVFGVWCVNVLGFVLFCRVFVVGLGEEVCVVFWCFEFEVFICVYCDGGVGVGCSLCCCFSG